MIIRCKYCNHESKLNIPKNIQGKLIRFKCQNKSCAQLIEVRVPSEVTPEESTIVSKSVQGEIDYAMLEVVPNQFIGHEKYKLGIGTTTIGRKSNTQKADISLKTSDTDMSRIHCSIRSFIDPLGSTSFVLSDEGSKNGVYLNDQRLDDEDEVYLVDNDIIKLGNTSLVFVVKYKQS